MPQILYSGPKQDGSVDFWYVERLWEVSKNLPIHSVKIADLPGMDEVLWFGGPKNIQATCGEVTEHARQIQVADLSFPIILSAEGEVWDGMHRVARATLEGLSELKAVQFSVNPAPDGTIDRMIDEANSDTNDETDAKENSSGLSELPSSVDKNLVEAAIDQASRRFPEGESGAAAVYLEDGSIITSVCFDSPNEATNLCHETGAYCEAYRRNLKVIASVCVVRENSRSQYIILTPCGVCQERLATWGMSVEVAVPVEKNPTQWLSVPLSKVQPFYWKKPFKSD